jgi:hypothetical protein
MTELVVPYTDTTVVVSSQDVAVRRLTEWATSAQAASSVAAELVKTSFVPESFRGKPYEATAAILAGLELGLSPMASLRSFDVIQGQAAPRAITLRAVAQANGHDIVLEESTATRCRMRGKRAGSHEWQSVTWTIDRAKSLNLLGKTNWKSQPQAMLVARATSEICRLVAADALLGIAYSAEEIADGGPVELEVAQATVTEPTPIGTRRMSRKRATEPTAEPPPPVDQPAEPDQPADDDDPAHPSQGQTKMAMALFSEAGITERDERLAATSAYIGRDVGSWNELTKAEASTVIDTLVRSTSGDAS